MRKKNDCKLSIANYPLQIAVPRARFRTSHSALRTQPFRTPPRRGILLLVVLSLLTLFLLIGTAFIVSANHYRRTNKALARVTEAANSSYRQGDLLDEVLNQIVRDTNNQFSSLRFHSLLRDMYGSDGVKIGPRLTPNIQFVNRGTFPPVGSFPSANTLDTQMMRDRTGDQFFWVAVDATLPPLPTAPALPGPPVLGSVDNYYNGNLFTFVDGDLAGTTARIVRYEYELITAPVVGTPGRAIAVFTLLPLKAKGLIKSITLTANNVVGPSNRAIINGRPFNGTGVGYNRNTTAANAAKLNAMERVVLSGSTPNYPLGLMPNASFFDADNVDHYNNGTFGWGRITQNYFSPYTDPSSSIFNSTIEREYVGLGGSDESYDAVDFQNMALALMQVNPGEFAIPADNVLINRGIDNVIGTPDDRPVVLPSFHRPALINYWRNQTALVTEPNLLRKVIMRPSWYDHPNFTGSNPELASNVQLFATALATGGDTATPSGNLLQNMIYGQWDVDNDNDGVRDSVWVDFGAPVMMGPDGRLVKPLAAVLVLDMDGRLNVNAHGTVDLAGMGTAPAGKQLAGTTFSNTLPRGQGYGPAEISLAPVLGNTSMGDNRFNEFLAGDTLSGSDIAGRYGRKNVDGLPGIINTYGLAAQMKMQGTPQFFGTSNVLSAYGSPPDLNGRYGLGLNNFGQPVYEALADTINLDSNTPYELDLSSQATRGVNPNGADAPFSLGELERVLRPYDVDAGKLPPRLWDLARGNVTTPLQADLDKWRTLLTTDSYDLPVPNVVVPAWMIVGRDKLANTADDYAKRMGKPATNATFSDLLEYRLRDAVPTITPIQLRQRMAMLLPRDLANGLRLDINRTLGNGRDDQAAAPPGTPGKGVVDEPGEIEGAYWKMDTVRGTADMNGNTALNTFENQSTGGYRDDIDRDGDGVITALERGDTNDDGMVDFNDDLVATHNFRRQMLARDLYVLAMTLVNPYDLTTTTGKAKTRSLAQWAINVVDFRDPDNIMTAFEYDENPFDGWGVDGNLSTNEPGRKVAWGCERPELLITETLAWHDLATENLDNESANPGEKPNDLEGSRSGIPKDVDRDQLERPRGGAFVELYNPWPSNPAANADTHDVSTMSGTDLGVDLGAFAIDPNDATKNSPVWRLMVYRVGGLNSDPDDPAITSRPTGPDRSVYFTTSTQVDGTNLQNLDPSDGVAFYATLLVRSVRPGRYMVVGSGEDFDGDGIYESRILRPRQSPSQQQANPLRNRRIELDLSPTAINAVRMRDENATGLSVKDAQDGYLIESPRDPTPIDNRQSLADVALINEPRRFTLSEPADGYPTSYPNPFNPFLQWYGPMPTPNNPGAWNASGVSQTLQKLHPEGFYGTSPSSPKPIDTPLDKGFRWLRNDGLVLSNPQTKVDFREIYLQRLANPLLPWNPEVGRPGHNTAKAVNPYLTVDVSTSNLTVFNGRENQLGLRAMNERAGNNFYSIERGWRNDPTNLTGNTDQGLIGENPWSVENPFNSLSVASRPPRRPRQPQRVTSPNSNTFTVLNIPDTTMGFLNRSFMDPALPLTAKQLTPVQPFPWLAWNNRPFVSGMELMQVPNTRSSKLLKNFSIRGTRNEVYSGSTTNTTSGAQLDGVFRHQPNFFRFKKGTGNSGIVGLYRVLDYLHVPSRFVGTESWLNPTRFGDTTPVNNTTDPRYQLQPPFNQISSYRDPGRVNLNTISSKEVLDGLFHRNSGTLTPHSGPLWNNFRNVRRGYTPTGGATGMLALRNEVPTFFENPFRSADAGNNVPLDATPTAASDMTRAGVECTLNRSSTVSGVTAATNTPLFAAATTNPYNNANRNAHFRYQPMTRMANLTTTRSNVYAVWVTVGFFEVEEVDLWGNLNTTQQARYGTKAVYDKVYPDGYQFGKEAGSDTGNLHRLREFAIVDRTIPVAFEPGVNHNVDRAIPLRRRLE